YVDIGALNAAWGTEFADFDHVEPLTTDQVRRRELGGVRLPANLRPFAEWLEFADASFAAAVAHLAAQARRGAPGSAVGRTGLQGPPAFGGHDYAALLPPLSLVEPYDVGGARELARSLLPRAQHWTTLAVPEQLAGSKARDFERLCTAQ